MYADDIVLFCPSAIGLSKLLEICEEYGDKHDIKYNSKKSSVIICRNKYNKHVEFSPYTVKGENIGQVSSSKYLGHIICDNLKDDI